MIPCECEWNCGILIPEFDKQGRKRRFVKGHYGRGKHLSLEAKQKMSENHVDFSGEKHPMFGKHHSPKTKKKIGDGNRGKIHSDATRKLQSDAHTGKTRSPETKQKISENRKGKYSGEKHPNWQGGISKLPYCFEFTKLLKSEIKERDDYQCQNPNCCNFKNTTLAVHHIDYNKKNCSTNNLITLCKGCNSRANYNREFWQEFYSNIINKFSREEL